MACRISWKGLGLQLSRRSSLQERVPLMLRERHSTCSCSRPKSIHNQFLFHFGPSLVGILTRPHMITSHVTLRPFAIEHCRARPTVTILSLGGCVRGGRYINSRKHGVILTGPVARVFHRFERAEYRVCRRSPPIFFFRTCLSGWGTRSLDRGTHREVPHGPARAQSDRVDRSHDPRLGFVVDYQ